ncbi:MAG: hypothetical protein HY550_00225 [Elusimicrobia bacterium]|nr:hypothetical protein [Elusimicrobiota bacterium]
MKKTGTGKTIRSKLLNGFGRALSFSALLFLAAGLRPAALRAEVPVKFTYQGNLRQGGFLVNGNRSMVFRLYASSTSAVELWASPAYNVSLSTGVFRVALEPVIADWQSGSLWLELEVEGNRLSPREELTSSPYAINSLMLSGKRYTTAPAAPAASASGDLWYDSSLNALNFWNGGAWLPVSGSGVPGSHASSHGGAGTDPIVSLGTHTVTGYITVSSAVSAGWLSGDGSGVYNLDASKINSGYLSGDRLGGVIVSTHIADGSIQNQDLAAGSITKDRLNQSGCAEGNILQLIGGVWSCGAASGAEADPLSIHSQETLQAGTTFYVSSGTVNALNVENSLKVTGTAQLRGAAGQTGLSVAAAGNVGIGTENPAARLEVTGEENPGQYIAVFNSGSKLAAWLRNK